MATRKTQQQPDVTDSFFWRTIFRGVPMRLEYRDLSNQRLRVAGQLFGEDYEIPMEFIRRLLVGNMTALTVAVWIGLQKANKWPFKQDGHEIDDPRQLDFNIDEHFEALEDPQPPAKGKGPQVPPTTTGTSTDPGSESETDTSSSSSTEE
jgi:hypothetical protein